MSEFLGTLGGLALLVAWCLAPIVAIVSDTYTKLDVLAAIILPMPLDWVWLIFAGGA